MIRSTPFYQELERHIQDIVAADERRHNIEHISKFLSVRDMIKQVSNNLPAGTPVPSD